MAVSTNWREAKLQPADQAMLEFSEKLTLLPSDLRAEDAARLRQHGFTDREILSITLAAAYRNFITRVADALGVELRQGETYTQEILTAFGVTEYEARSSMYGDRATAGEEEPLPQRAFPAPQRTANPPESPQAPCWIETSSPEEDRSARLRQEIEHLTQPLPMKNLAMAFNLRPEALEAALAFGRLVGMGGSGLGRRMEAVIGLAVASTLEISYMRSHHTQSFLAAGGSAEELQSLLRNPSDPPLPQQEREAARFCAMMTRQPTSVAQTDVAALRQSGMDDRAILTLAASAAFENFIGRVAAGLGVQPEVT